MRRMTDAKRAFLQRRLKRRELWVSLWLARVFACLWLFGGEPRGSVWRDWFEATLNRLARQVMGIIFCHVVFRAKFDEGRGFNDPRAPRDGISFRSAIGGELRRAFKAKSLAERLEKIRWAFDERDVLIARLARRLRRGMTRRIFAHTRAPIGGDVVLLRTLRGVEIAGADTS